MMPAKRQQLDRLVDKIAAALGANVSRAVLLDRLICEDGARFRFTCGAYELRIAGVVATTTNRTVIFERWMQAALRRIAREAQP